MALWELQCQEGEIDACAVVVAAPPWVPTRPLRDTRVSCFSGALSLGFFYSTIEPEAGRARPDVSLYLQARRRLSRTWRLGDKGILAAGFQERTPASSAGHPFQPPPSRRSNH